MIDFIITYIIAFLIQLMLEKVDPVYCNESPVYINCFVLLFPLLFSLAFFRELPLPTNHLWMMGLTLSYTDIKCYTVEPIIFLSFSSITLFTKYSTIGLLWKDLYLPFAVCFLFFIILMIMPNSFGLGDVKILILWSFFISAFQLCWLLFLASAFALFFIASYYLLYGTLITKLPFVPFLFVALVWVTF